MLCQYCKKEMKLERFIEREWENGKYCNERFVYNCSTCSIAVSPKFILLDCCETEEEKRLIRDLHFLQDKISIEKKQENKQECC
ncbi:MAG: hypothetical protein WC979_07570 [Candidatus Pacearchaeota archaeon]|jgi:hypothetical protein